ncbi:unnamed protein product [Soboliphyme baturini]|uniref:Tetraspanin n=1 Tax=Soboliphyme baturini TaxID=241478 RepID=A0A183J3Q4_9BILA|nr:unnamed protein product [Soboliphyme baturini]
MIRTFAGFAVLGLGIWSLCYKSDYASLLTSSTYIVTVYLFTAAGVLVLFLGIFGCVGLYKENRSCLLLFTFSLLLIFVIEAVAGVLSYIYCEQIDRELKQNFQQTLMERYGSDETVTKATDRLHETHGCCGAEMFRDWRNSTWYKTVNSEAQAKKRDGKIQQVPDVCCRSVKPGCGRRDHPSNIYYEGCLPVLRHEIQEQEVILGAVALGISAIEVNYSFMKLMRQIVTNFL